MEEEVPHPTQANSKGDNEADNFFVNDIKVKSELNSSGTKEELNPNRHGLKEDPQS